MDFFETLIKNIKLKLDLKPDLSVKSVTGYTGIVFGIGGVIQLSKRHWWASATFLLGTQHVPCVILRWMIP